MTEWTWLGIRWYKLVATMWFSGLKKALCLSIWYYARFGTSWREAKMRSSEAKWKHQSLRIQPMCITKVCVFLSGIEVTAQKNQDGLSQSVKRESTGKKGERMNHGSIDLIFCWIGGHKTYSKNDHTALGCDHGGQCSWGMHWPSLGSDGSALGHFPSWLAWSNTLW